MICGICKLSGKRLLKMQISKLQIENFRSIQKLEIDLTQLCAFVGANNSGKSNLLAVIHRVLGRDWVTVNSFTLDDIYGRNPENVMKIHLLFEPELTYLKYKYSDPVNIASICY